MSLPNLDWRCYRMRLIDADELIRNLEGIISDYTSNGIYPEKFGIDDFID